MEEVTTRVKIQHKRSNDRWHFSTVQPRLKCGTLAYFSTQEQIYVATLASIMAMLNITDPAVF